MGADRLRRAASDEAAAAGLLLAALRHDRTVVLAGLAAVVALAWIYMLLGAGVEMPVMDMGGGETMAMPPEWSIGHAVVLFAMWAVMMAAMMLPSAAPVTLLVAGIARKRGVAARAVPAFFVLGYLAVWAAFAAAATALQWALDAAGMLSPAMALGNRLAAGAVLAAAGLYQWTPFKAACLRRCRSPLGFLMLHWRDGALGAVSSGVRHGLFCLGCCAMLMALLFVGGVMSLAWVGGIALLVLVEKTLPWGGRMSLVTGGALVAWGVATLATAL